MDPLGALSGPVFASPDEASTSQGRSWARGVELGLITLSFPFVIPLALTLAFLAFTELALVEGIKIGGRLTLPEVGPLLLCQLWYVICARLAMRLLAPIMLLSSDRDPRLPFGHVVIELLGPRLIANAPQKFLEGQLVCIPEILVISESADEYLLERYLLEGIRQVILRAASL